MTSSLTRMQAGGYSLLINGSKFDQTWQTKDGSLQGKKKKNLLRKLLCLFIDALAAWRRSCMIFCRWTGSSVGTGAEITSVCCLFTDRLALPELPFGCKRGGLPDMTDPWWEPQSVCWDWDCDTAGDNNDILEGKLDETRWWCDEDVTPALLAPSVRLKSAMSTGLYCGQSTHSGRDCSTLLIPIPVMSIIVEPQMQRWEAQDENSVVFCTESLRPDWIIQWFFASCHFPPCIDFQ